MNKEYSELANKCIKLEKFTMSPLFNKVPAYEQQLLQFQLAYMQAYKDVLNKRIVLANK